MVAEIGKRLPPGGLELEKAFWELVPQQARLALEAAEQAWIDAGKPIQARKIRHTRNDWLQRSSIRNYRVLHPTFLRTNDAYEACKNRLRDRLGRGEVIAAGCLGSLTGTAWAVEPGDWQDAKFKIHPIKYGGKGRNRIVLADKQELWQVRVYESVSVSGLIAAPEHAEIANPDLLKGKVITAFNEMIARGELDPEYGGQAKAARNVIARLKLPKAKFATVKGYIGPFWHESLMSSEANRRKSKK